MPVPAVDKAGQAIDFFLSRNRDVNAALQSGTRTAFRAEATLSLATAVARGLLVTWLVATRQACNPQYGSPGRNHEEVPLA
jgi:hypothetical protein